VLFFPFQKEAANQARRGHISPVTWAMDAYTELIFFGGSLATVLVPVAVLLGMAVVFFTVGALRFRYE
jgi:ABC-type multidrug transport system permease subunit